MLYCQENPLFICTAEYSIRCGFESKTVFPCHNVRTLSSLIDIPLIIMCRKMLPQMLLQRS